MKVWTSPPFDTLSREIERDLKSLCANLLSNQNLIETFVYDSICPGRQICFWLRRKVWTSPSISYPTQKNSTVFECGVYSSLVPVSFLGTILVMVNKNRYYNTICCGRHRFIDLGIKVQTPLPIWCPIQENWTGFKVAACESSVGSASNRNYCLRLNLLSTAGFFLAQTKGREVLWNLISYPEKFNGIWRRCLLLFGACFLFWARCWWW